MDFSEWLLRELEKRDMTQAKLARAAGLTTGGVTHLVNRTRRPSAETCRAIARAFRMPPEAVFRVAGLLPPVPRAEAQREEFLYLLNQLDDEDVARLKRQVQAEIDHKKGKHASTTTR